MKFRSVSKNQGRLKINTDLEQVIGTQRERSSTIKKQPKKTKDDKTEKQRSVFKDSKFRSGHKYGDVDEGNAKSPESKNSHKSVDSGTSNLSKLTERTRYRKVDKVIRGRIKSNFEFKEVKNEVKKKTQEKRKKFGNRLASQAISKSPKRRSLMPPAGFVSQNKLLPGSSKRISNKAVSEHPVQDFASKRNSLNPASLFKSSQLLQNSSQASNRPNLSSKHSSSNKISNIAKEKPQNEENKQKVPDVTQVEDHGNAFLYTQDGPNKTLQKEQERDEGEKGDKEGLSSKELEQMPCNEISLILPKGDVAETEDLVNDFRLNELQECDGSPDDLNLDSKKIITGINISVSPSLQTLGPSKPTKRTRRVKLNPKFKKKVRKSSKSLKSKS